MSLRPEFTRQDSLSSSVSYEDVDDEPSPFSSSEVDQQQFVLDNNSLLEARFSIEHVKTVLSQLYKQLTCFNIFIMILVYIVIVSASSIFFFFVASTDVNYDDNVYNSMNTFEYLHYSFTASRRILHWKRLLIVIAFQLFVFISHLSFFLTFFQYCKNKYVQGPLIRMEHLKTIYKQKLFIAVSLITLTSMISLFLLSPNIVNWLFGL